MKKMMIVMAMVVGLLMGGCAATMTGVQNKWGPPARIEQAANGQITHYYYFYKGKGSGVSIPIGNRGAQIDLQESMAGWIVVAITYDKENKIVNKNQYWAQPNFNK